ncbi:MAG: Na(+)/H(+) antiporter subunit F [Verrucomicrobiae bacterium]|nr:Na(+)/H(+) antiporter subunit F [Verrucomicrobiae bacterium]
MMETIFQIALGGLGLAIVLALFRLLAGPTIIDRMLAFDLIAVAGVGMIAVISAMRGTTVFVELVLGYSLVGFLGTVALTLYLQRGHRGGRSGVEKGGRDD